MRIAGILISVLLVLATPALAADKLYGTKESCRYFMKHRGDDPGRAPDKGGPLYYDGFYVIGEDWRCTIFGQCYDATREWASQVTVMPWRTVALILIDGKRFSLLRC